MSVPTKTVWELDPHTKAKHDILRHYLEAWFPILSSREPRIVYIDGFCGPGRYLHDEPGSPIIALDVALNHRKAIEGEVIFWFIEERDDRLQQLRQELSTRAIPAHFRVICDSGKFHERFGDVLKSIQSTGKTLAPTFAFIDPFGFSGIPLELIQKLLRTNRCEALVTFMVDSMNRFLEHPEDAVSQHIVEAFGGDEAIRIAKGSANRVDALRALYQANLMKVARFVRYFEMRDAGNRVQYYLFFATNNEVGHLKMKEAMWKVDPNGEFRFSDATDPSQNILFGSDADATPLLVRQLQKEFAGKGSVTGRQVRQFIENRTAYLKKHMTQALRQLEQSGKIDVEPLKSDGTKRRANSFPDEVRLAWV